MYERFTDRLRRVMQLANAEAVKLNHEYIGVEHITLGMIKEGSSVAVNVLKNLDVDLQKLRREVEKQLTTGPQLVTNESMPLTPRAQRVVAIAEQEAERAAQRRASTVEVSSEHMLLALLAEKEGVAFTALEAVGLSYDRAYEEIEDLLGFSEHVTPVNPVYFLLDPGSASATEVGELYYEISKLYRMMGGCGIRFKVSDCRLPQLSENLQ